MMQQIPEKRPLVPRRDWLIRDLLSFPQEASVSSDDSAKKQSSQKETVCFDSLLSHKNEEHNLEDATAIVILKQNQSLRSNQILADPNLSRAT